MTLRRWYLPWTIPLVSFWIGCDSPDPVEPVPDPVEPGIGARASGTISLKPPSGTDAKVISSSSIRLTWTDNSTNEEGFRVQRAPTSTGPWATVRTTGPNTTSISDGGRTSEERVCYRVRAFKGASQSAFSNTDCTVPPAAVTNLTAAGADHRTIDLAWKDMSAVEESYQVQRGPGETGPYSVVANLPANAAGYRDTALQTGTTYWYRVRARSDGGFSDFSNLASATPALAPPKAPSAANATPQPGGMVEVSWLDNSSNEDGFRLERSPDGGSTWTTVRTVALPNLTSLQDYGTTLEQQACYRVIAFNGQGDSPPSNTDCTTPPAAPTNLTASAADQQAIVLAWSDHSAVEDGYALFRHTGNGVPGVTIDLPANTTSYRDDGLSSNTTYWYTVKAKKDGGFSVTSNVASASTATTPPSAPSGADAWPAASSWIAVTWQDNSSNEDRFRIERSTDGGASWVTAGDTLANQTTWIDVGRTSEQQVCYRVLATNSQGDSPVSNSDCATPPTGPTNLTGVRVEGGVELSWTDNSAVEDGYLVMAYGGLSEFGYPLPPNSTSYLATGEDIDWCINSVTGCTFYVVATKDGGYSDYSNGVQVP